jgi:hypothetical protein
MVNDTKGILDVAMDFYKNLFKRESRGSLSLEADFWDVTDKVSAMDREALEAPFSEEDIKLVVFSCYPKGSPGPDGLPFLFY